MTRQNHDSFTALVDALDSAALGDRVHVDEILDRVGARSFGALLMLLGIANVLPIGAIPGFPILTLVLTSLISGQVLLGRRRLWLPRRVRRLSVGRERMAASLARARGMARRLDRWVGNRLVWATGPLAQRLAAALCILLSVTMIPLGLIPFGVALPGLAIAIIGLAMLVRDGLIMLIGGGIAGAAGAAIVILIG